MVPKITKDQNLPKYPRNYRWDAGDFRVELKKDWVDDGEPENYYYIHLFGKFSRDSLGWICYDDALILYQKLGLALNLQKRRNQELGWKE